MPQDGAFASKIQIVPGHSVELPSGKFAAGADFTREGMDLHLNSADGQHIVVENYFNQGTPPNLITPDGARLSPDLVDAFLPPVHGREYASASDTTSDVSAAGQITEVVGSVMVTHADGSKTSAAVGTAIYPGDVVETSSDGAANILFADNTTFAISESARLAVNEYAFNAEAHSGNTFFSMLQGVFVYTSGMIGHNNPHDVKIETPVGSIGIRGTIVAGDIRPAGEESKITIVQGAIVVTNDGGRVDLDNNLETASFSGYQQAPQEMGQINTDSFTSYYSAAESVAASTFSKVYDGTYVKMDAAIRGETPAPTDAAPGEGDGNSNTQDAPSEAPSNSDDHTSVDGNVQTAQTTAEVIPVVQEAPEIQQPLQTTTEAIVQPVVLPPPPVAPLPPVVTSTAGSFTGTQTTTTFSNTTGTTFSSGTTTTGTTNGTTGATGTTTTIFTGGDGTTTNNIYNATLDGDGDDIGGVVIIPGGGMTPDVNFNFSSLYTKGTTTLSDDGIPLFGLGWPANGVIGQGSVLNFLGTASSYELIYTDGTVTNTLTASGTIYGDVYGIDATSPDPYTTMVLADQALFTFNATTGAITLLDPLGLTQQLNGDLQFTLKAKNSAGTIIGTENFVLLMENFAGNVLLGTAGNDGVTTAIPAGTGGIIVTNSNTFVNAYGGDDRVEVNANSTGNKIFMGQGSDLAVVYSPGFGTIDGGDGVDRIIFKSNAMYDLTVTGASKLKSFQTLELGGTTDAADVKLNLQNIFDMVGAGGTLTVKTNGVGQVGRLLIDTDAFTIASGTLVDDPNLTGIGNASGSGDVVLSGAYNGATVTLVIQQGNSTDGVVVTNI